MRFVLFVALLFAGVVAGSSFDIRPGEPGKTSIEQVRFGCYRKKGVTCHFEWEALGGSSEEWFITLSKGTPLLANITS